MPKMMSFALTTNQFRAKTKRVTRRDGWWNLKADELIMGVEKLMGLKKGQRVNRLGYIRVENTRPEPLEAITQRDVILEGFPDMTPAAFIDFFCRTHKVRPDHVINRIAYDYEEVERDQKALDLLNTAWELAQQNAPRGVTLVTRDNFGDVFGPWIRGSSEEFPSVILENLDPEQQDWVYSQLWSRPCPIQLKAKIHAS